MAAVVRAAGLCCGPAAPSLITAYLSTETSNQSGLGFIVCSRSSCSTNKLIWQRHMISLPADGAATDAAFQAWGNCFYLPSDYYRCCARDRSRVSLFEITCACVLAERFQFISVTRRKQVNKPLGWRVRISERGRSLGKLQGQSWSSCLPLAAAAEAAAGAAIRVASDGSTPVFNQTCPPRHTHTLSLASAVCFQP